MIENFSKKSVKISDIEKNLDVTQKNHGKNDFQHSNIVIFMTLLANSFGVSSMGLSSIAARTGIVLFLFQLFLATVINYYSYYTIIELTVMYKLKNFEQLCQLMLGKFKIIAIVLMIICNVGNMVGNMLIFLKYFQSLLEKTNLIHIQPSLKENIYQLLLLAVFIFPLILKRQFKDFFFVSYISILIMLFLVVFIFQQFTNNIKQDFSQVKLIDPTNFISNYSYLFFCLVGQQGIIIICNENNQKNSKKMTQITKHVFCLLFFVYSIFGIFGYLTFNQSQNVSELTYLALFKRKEVLIIFAQAFMLIICLIAYLYLFKPTRDLIENFILVKMLDENKEKEFGWQNLSVTIFFKLGIIYLTYLVLKYQISFITLIDNISELIIPWLFIFLPIYTLIQINKKKRYYSILIISFGFFIYTLIEKLKNFI